MCIVSAQSCPQEARGGIRIGEEAGGGRARAGCGEPPRPGEERVGVHIGLRQQGLTVVEGEA